MPPSLWMLRAAWVAVPLVAGPALGDALAPHSRPFVLVASALGWVGWAAGLLALLVPRSVSLTVARLVVPGALVASIAAVPGAARPGAAAAAVAVSGLALLALAAPGPADILVDGSSYGAERRVALKVPPVLLLGPLPLAWAAWAAAVVSGPLLLAARAWVVGGVGLIAGLAVAAVVARQFHGLSRRWLVFVPAGVVVHDPLTLADPILLTRALVRRFGPALVGTGSCDLSRGALGRILELEVGEPVDLVLRVGRGATRVEVVRGVLVAPTRPGAALELAAAGRLRVA